MQQNDERALSLVDVVHANAVDFGKAVVECVGVVGIHLPQCGARLTDVLAGLVSIVFLHHLKCSASKVALTGCSALSLSGHNLVKLGQVTMYAWPDP